DNGYAISIYFRILRTTGSPLRIKLDITRRDREIKLLYYEKRRIIHPFSDVVETSVLSYSFEEVFAEKIRALFERTRSRDLYDVWRLSQLGLDVSSIINDKFCFKEVTFNLETLIERRKDFDGSWEASLKHQLSVLPDFEKVFEDVVKYLKNLSLEI
ncbi:nucleotidyl transferase AbiEii/AbiGii toxin family protein, partial [Candidatus Bathyarchaeota archaeon]|nr:nucleotidyl transferase AbiEii/AbiGii toxin family protein [Candidatus Bathyarchaeota archaeon]